MENLENYVNNLSGISEEQFKSLMNNDNKLTREEKCYLYYYLFPKPLLDRELPSRILNARKDNPKGELYPVLKEVCILIEACNTLQYSKFMKHILHSFTDPLSMFPVLGNQYTYCPICGKKIFELDIWTNLSKDYPIEQDKKEFLAFGSKNSQLSVCIDCIIQLNEVFQIINRLNPSFLDWRKGIKSAKLSWEDFKL